jgi:hypothetical protein
VGCEPEKNKPQFMNFKSSEMIKILFVFLLTIIPKVRDTYFMY